MRVRLVWKFVLILILGLAPLAASADVLKLVVDGTIQPLSRSALIAPSRKHRKRMRKRC